MARGSPAIVMTICLLANAFCLPPNINRLTRDITDNELTDAKETKQPTEASSVYTPNPYDDDDDDDFDDDFPETTNTSSGDGRSNVFTLLKFVSALFPSLAGGSSNTHTKYIHFKTLIRKIMQDIIGYNARLKVTLRCRDTKEIISQHRSKREPSTLKLQRQEIELNSVESSESESSSSSESKPSSSSKSESTSSSNSESESSSSSESESSSSSESESSSSSASKPSSSSRSESTSSSSSSSESESSSSSGSDSNEESKAEESLENNNDSDENNAAEVSVENNNEGSSSIQDSDSDENSNESDYDSDEPPGGDGQGGGILGLLAGLSGGNGDTDLGSLLAAISGIVINLSGDGIDVNSIITSAVGLFVGLLSEGEKNPGSIVASYLITSLDTITGGGANNNGAFFGKFISRLLKGISAVGGDSEESSEENSSEIMADSFGFFTSFLMGLLGDMSKGSSGGKDSN